MSDPGYPPPPPFGDEPPTSYGPPGQGPPRDRPPAGGDDYPPPGFGAPDDGTPGYPPPGYGAPGYPPPSYGAPGYRPPGYGAPGYGAPGYGYLPGYGGYPPPRKTNGLAIGSLVLGLIGIVGCQIFGIPGLVMGIIARRQIRDRGEDGAGIALAGIITSAIACLLLVTIGLLYGTMIAWLGTSGTSGSSPYRTSTSRYRSTTTEFLGGVPGTGPSITAAPSGLLPVAVCPRVTLAIKNLESPQNLDNAILTDAARTLHLDLPASFGDDIDTLFADALTRVGSTRAGKPSGDAAAADLRIATAIGDACP